jgi:hypothetical protein
VRLPSRVLSSAAAVAVLGVLAMGCGDDGPGDTAKFCGEVKAHSKELLTAPTSLAEVPAFLGLYKRIDKVAPLAIQPHWDALILNFETASSVDPADPASVQKALALAYATEASAVKVHDFLLANCAVDIGPVATIVAHDAATAPGTAPAGSVAATTPSG